MNRQAPYGEANANLYGGSQRQNLSDQMMQQHAGMSDFHGRPDSFPAEQGNLYVSAQWNRDGQRSYSEARQGGNAGQSVRHAQIADTQLDLENEANRGPRFQSHEEDMEIGYEDKPSALTFEVLEHKFQDEILKLLKEQSDAEDAEIARHGKRIIEINNQYQDKLAVLRVRQAGRREEFLRKESEGRLQKYQHPGIQNTLSRTALNDLHGYSGHADMDAQRAYHSGQADYNREEPPYQGGRRSQGTEGRVPYPAGRVYNNPGRYY